MESREQLETKIKELIIEALMLEDLAPEDIGSVDPLFGDGLGLDSIDALELVVLVEDRFRVSIPDEEVGQRAFASVNSLVEFILAEQPS